MKRSPEITSMIMSKIKSTNTKPELLFGSTLFGCGVRYRKHIKVIGRPDFGIRKYKIAIFIDGDFWHGHNWVLKGYKSINTELRKYSVFWRNKIRRNIKRDDIVNYELKKAGWKIFRFWASDVTRDAKKYAEKVVIYMKRIGAYNK
jgi:DNA mismatch endonuclease, patch repair protein